jgi:hypothetical protein
MDLNVNGLEINKPAGQDHINTPNLKVIRDANNLSSSWPQYYNMGAYFYTKAGPNQQNFEWNILAELHNYSNHGENTGAYIKGYKFGKGATWGACIEASEEAVTSSGSIVGLEVDCWVSGDHQFRKIGLDILVGDALHIRGKPGAGHAEATIGMRVAASSGSPWARWEYGLMVRDFKQTGIHVEGNGTRGIHLMGSAVVGIDTSMMECTTAIRLKRGQQLSFDEFDDLTMKVRDGMLVINADNGGDVLRFDPATKRIYIEGEIWRNGQKIL